MQMGLHEDLSEWTEEQDHFLEPFSGYGGKLLLPTALLE